MAKGATKIEVGFLRHNVVIPTSYVVTPTGYVKYEGVHNIPSVKAKVARTFIKRVLSVAIHMMLN